MLARWKLGGRIVAAGLFAGGWLCAAAALLVEQGCARQAPKSSAEPPIVVGVSLGLTRGASTNAPPIRDAIRVAEGEINAAGGLLGRQVRFDVVDDRGDEGDFVTKVAQDFADRGVAAVIGPLASEQVKRTHRIFADKQILEITPSAMSTELVGLQPGSDRFLFRTTPADDVQGAAVALFAAKTPSGIGDGGAPNVDAATPVICQRLALVHVDNAYGTALANQIADTFPKEDPVGRRVVIDKKIPVDVGVTYASEVAEIVDEDPECLAIVAYEGVAARFIRDFKASTKYPTLEQRGFIFIGTDGIYNQGFLDLSRAVPSNEASPSTAEGVYGTHPDTQPTTDEYAAFRTLHASYFPLAHGELDAPTPFAANAFDAAILVAFAIQKAQSATDRVAIRDALRAVSSPPGRPITPAEILDGLVELRAGREIDYRGASGNVDLQPNGNVTGGFIVWQALRDTVSNEVVYKTVARFDVATLTEQMQ